MKAEEFYKQFSGLDSQVSLLDGEVRLKKTELGHLENSLETKKFMQRVLAGLKTTPNQSDPGKHDPAFYFVAEIKCSDIKEAGEPSLYQPCPQCKADQPVLMLYLQTEDTPDGDTWEKDAFILCAEDGIYKLAHFESDHRF